VVALTVPAVDTLEKRVEAAQAELKTSIDRAGLRDDVLRLPLLALSDTIGLFPGLVSELREAVEKARRPVDPLAVARIEAAAAVGASDRAGQLARTHIWRSGVIAGAVITGVGVMGALGGYLAGRSSAVATVSAVQAAAVRDGPEAAALWAQLMAANDGRLVAQICKETGARSEGGRHACALGLWTEPPTNSIPRTSPASK